LHTLPGLSKISFDSVCHALAEINYQGEITLEADAFLEGFDEELYPDAVRLMAKRAKNLADKVEHYKRVLKI
jgi:sugar phosphate isomerase/epimerase